MVADAVFLAFAATVIGGAVFAVFFKNVFYNALGLGLSLFGVAGLYIYLGSEFLAVMQIIIYVGAIAIAILFAVMLSQPMWIESARTPEPKRLRAAVLAVILFILIARILLSATWPAASETGDYSIARVGELLLTRYLLPFEVISLVLLVAIIGALLISRPEERK